MTPYFDPRYVAARRVLLDALDALTPHRPAVIVAGAQAVYLHTGDSDLGIAPYTTDGDLALDPTLLDDDPQLASVMRNAGFTPLLPNPDADHVEPGIWTSTVTVAGDEIAIPIDLIVPEALAGTGRRGARLGAHGNQAARRARGLEAALIDHATMTIRALEPADIRTIDVEVAGPAALLVAKAHKIHDRLTSTRPDRAIDKDAGDVYRLMQTTSPTDVGTRMAEMRDHDVAGAVTREALKHLSELFGQRNGQGIRMAISTFRLVIPDEQITVLATSYAQRLLDAAEAGPA